MSDQGESPKCPKCHRPDCAMLATVIVGRRGWFEGFAECMEAQERRANRATVGKPQMIMGHEQYRTLRERGIA